MLFPWVFLQNDSNIPGSDTEESVVRLLKGLSESERQQRVLVVDNDLEGSCGLKKAPVLCGCCVGAGRLWRRAFFWIFT